MYDLKESLTCYQYFFCTVLFFQNGIWKKRLLLTWIQYSIYSTIHIISYNSRSGTYTQYIKAAWIEENLGKYKHLSKSHKKAKKTGQIKV